jgi:hypothetical protein
MSSYFSECDSDLHIKSNRFGYIRLCSYFNTNLLSNGWCQTKCQLLPGMSKRYVKLPVSQEALCRNIIKFFKTSRSKQKYFYPDFFSEMILKNRKYQTIMPILIISFGVLSTMFSARNIPSSLKPNSSLIRILRKLVSNV